jgi:hypothetical protein
VNFISKESKISLFTVCIICISSFFADAQSLIKGEIKDFGNNIFLSDVNVRNIYSQQGMTIKGDGLFEVVVKKGELIEFTKVGYQSIRIRITNEKEPSYYKLEMKKVPIELREVDINGKPLEFKKDSIRYRQVYDIILRKDKQEDIDMRSMPLAMLSRKNREEWAFQKMYARWEDNKYIDFTFNERLVSRITYLEGEELDEFIKLYRPSVEFLRNASEYEYLDYIKHCYYQYKRNKKADN